MRPPLREEVIQPESDEQRLLWLKEMVKTKGWMLLVYEETQRALQRTNSWYAQPIKEMQREQFNEQMIEARTILEVLQRVRDWIVELEGKGVGKE